MSILRFAFIFFVLFFSSQVQSQNKKADKIQFNVNETTYYNKYSSDVKYKLNFFINDEYVKGPYNENFFQKHFKSSPKAYKLSLDYLETNKKANQAKTKGIVLFSILGIAGLGSFLIVDDNTTKYTLTGISFASALTTSYIFNRKRHKLKKEAYFSLENALLAYQEENSSVYLKEEESRNKIETNKSDTEKENSSNLSSVNIDKDKTVSIKSEKLRGLAFKSISINFFGGYLSGSKKQLSPSLDLLYMKNGFFLNGNFKLHIYDTNRFFTKNKYEFNFSPLNVSFDPQAYPLELPLPYNASIVSVIPFRTTVKDGPILTKMKQYGNTQLMYRSTASIMHSWGLQLSSEMDQSIQNSGSSFDSEHIFPANTNSLNINIDNPAFFRKSINVSGGISFSMFTAYEMRPDEEGLDDSYKIVNWARIYLIGKYNLNSSFADMYYKGTVPVEFNNIEETKTGFAIGLEGAYLNNNRGFNFGAEFGMNPHISEGNNSDLYVILKIGYTFGKF